MVFPSTDFVEGKTSVARLQTPGRFRDLLRDKSPRQNYSVMFLIAQPFFLLIKIVRASGAGSLLDRPP